MTVYFPPPAARGEHQEVPDASPVDLRSVGLKDFSSIPIDQRKMLSPDEIQRVFTKLFIDLVYSRKIKFPSGDKEIPFSFPTLFLFLTLFKRIFAYKILEGFYIKGGSNESFFMDLPGDLYDIDVHIQVKDFRSPTELDSEILSSLAHVAGITCTDTQFEKVTKRIYWKGREKIVEISPAPPKGPSFTRHHECGRLFLFKGGLGNHLQVDQSNRKFIVYTIHGKHKGKEVKIDIHVVKELDHYSFCSKNCIYTALHPLLYALSQDPSFDPKQFFLDPHATPMWAKTGDGYSFEAALNHLANGQFSYDPPVKAASLEKGLVIHCRLLAKGNVCLTKGAEKFLHPKFVSQYFEEDKEKVPKIRLKNRFLEADLRYELKEHLRGNVLQGVCFLLNLIDLHERERTPHLEEVLEVHYRLLLELLGEKARGPKELKSFLHLVRIHAFLVDHFSVKRVEDKQRLHLHLPFRSIAELLASSKEILEDNQELLDNLGILFPVEGMELPAFYQGSLSKIFSSYSSGELAQIPSMDNPLASLENFLRFFPAWQQIEGPERLGSHLFFLLRLKKAEISSLSHQERCYLFEIIKKLGAKEEMLLLLDPEHIFTHFRSQALQAIDAGNEKFYQMGMAFFESHSGNSNCDSRFCLELLVHLFGTTFAPKDPQEFVKLLSKINGLSQEEFISAALPRLKDLSSSDLAKWVPSLFFSFQSFAAAFSCLQKIEAPERIAKHFLFLFKGNKKSLESLSSKDRQALEEIIASILKMPISTSLRNDIVFALDKENALGKIETNPKLQELTFTLLDTKSEVMFKRGVKVYESLSSQKDIDGKLLADLMARLLDSPFAIKNFPELMKILCASCRNEAHLHAQMACLQKAILNFQNNPRLFEAIWEPFKDLCEAHKSVVFASQADVDMNILLKQFHEACLTLKGQKGAACSVRVVHKCFTFPMLEVASAPYLPKYFALVFAGWKEDPIKGFELFLSLEGYLEKLSKEDYFQVVSQFVSFGPLHDKREKEFLLRAVKKVDSDKADLERLQKIFNAHGIFSRFSALAKFFEPPKPKSDVAPVSASSPIETVAKEKEDPLALIKSEEPFASIAQIEFVLNYLFKINLASPKSASFLERHTVNVNKRLLGFIRQMPKGEQSASEIDRLLQLVKKESLRIMDTAEATPPSALEQKLFLFSHQGRNYILQVCLLNFMVVKFLPEKPEKAVVELGSAMYLHFFSFQQGFVKPKGFVELWKKLVKTAFSHPQTFSVFIKMFLEIYGVSSVVAEGVHNLQKITIALEAEEQFRETGNITYFKLMTEILHELLHESGVSNKEDAPVDLVTVYRCAHRGLKAMLANVDLTKDKDNLKYLMTLCSILRGIVQPEKNQSWRNDAEESELLEVQRDTESALALVPEAERETLPIFVKDGDKVEEPTGADSLIKSAVLHYNHGLLQEGLGSCESAIVAYKRSLSDFLKLLKLDLANKDYVLQAWLTCQKLKSWEIAVSFLKSAVDGPHAKDAVVWNTLCAAYCNQRDFQSALKCAQKAFELDKENISTRLNLANCYFALDDIIASIEVLTDTIKKWPEDRSILLLRADNYKACKRFSEAIKDIRAYLAKEPGSKEVLAELRSLQEMEKAKKEEKKNPAKKQSMQWKQVKGLASFALENVFIQMIQNRKGKEKS